VRNTYIVALSHHDRSGIIQAFGPYDTFEEAEQAEGAIPDFLPALDAVGLWEIVLCADLVSEGWA
jgi:hypothetical protein